MGGLDQRSSPRQSLRHIRCRTLLPRSEDKLEDRTLKRKNHMTARLPNVFLPLLFVSCIPCFRRERCDGKRLRAFRRLRKGQGVAGCDLQIGPDRRRGARPRREHRLLQRPLEQVAQAFEFRRFPGVGLSGLPPQRWRTVRRSGGRHALEQCEQRLGACLPHPAIRTATCTTTREASDGRYGRSR